MTSRLFRRRVRRFVVSTVGDTLIIAIRGSRVTATVTGLDATTRAELIHARNDRDFTHALPAPVLSALSTTFLAMLRVPCAPRPCPCDRFVALLDTAERAFRHLERGSALPAGVSRRWLEERGALAPTCCLDPTAACAACAACAGGHR